MALQRNEGAAAEDSDEGATGDASSGPSMDEGDGPWVRTALSGIK
eukprot:CAMPEP_0182854270 /NCGR_PEP_ID=MMETSP0034_2-20130328/1148_1 /TAXON_ID=156128 /ORGANISM="Nephroselmis pyriformis, Strain CCMP717" /LENGTH=44 /DNA_ID= /DNA_START= /DNA_END= /DNA_ORIENTATION=